MTYEGVAASPYIRDAIRVVKVMFPAPGGPLRVMAEGPSRGQGSLGVLLTIGATLNASLENAFF